MRKKLQHRLIGNTPDVEESVIVVFACKCCCRSDILENDTPDVAVTRLFESAKKDTSQYGDYGAFTNCLQQLPPEGQIRATAAEVQTLLVYRGLT
ncbi:unnamed protein product [Lactuca saligna]|uniref:Uncharacterized protein n=1 Tax=Lactuca saligna TaxID=75948 RepID=A0AA35YXH4_LACSI|nr:unnamed protein product [Lactuca saligna]